MPVYLIQAGACGAVKIGTSNDVSRRIAKMQCDNAERLVILRHLDGGEALERTLHGRFSHLKIRAEWFRYCPTMMGDLGAPDLTAPAFQTRVPPEGAINDVFVAVGGAAEMSRITGMTRNSLVYWQRRGRIPADHWHVIIQAAEARGAKGVTFEFLKNASRPRKKRVDAGTKLASRFAA